MIQAKILLQFMWRQEVKTNIYYSGFGLTQLWLGNSLKILLVIFGRIFAIIVSLAHATSLQQLNIK